jgi:hypothetical protein
MTGKIMRQKWGPRVMKGLETGLGAAAIQTCPDGRAGRVGATILLQTRPQRESKICIDLSLGAFCRFHDAAAAV